MSPTKVIRLLKEALEKYGNIDIMEFIDYYYRKTYEGAHDWKVREKVTLQNIIDSNPDSTYHVGNFSIRDIIKYLAMEESAIKYFPYKIHVEYTDSKEAWEEMKRQHPKEEADKKAFLRHAVSLFNPDSESYHFVKKIYEI